MGTFYNLVNETAQTWRQCGSTKPCYVSYYENNCTSAPQCKIKLTNQSRCSFWELQFYGIVGFNLLHVLLQICFYKSDPLLNLYKHLYNKSASMKSVLTVWLGLFAVLDSAYMTFIFMLFMSELGGGLGVTCSTEPEGSREISVTMEVNLVLYFFSLFGKEIFKLNMGLATDAYNRGEAWSHIFYLLTRWDLALKYLCIIPWQCAYILFVCIPCIGCPCLKINWTDPQPPPAETEPVKIDKVGVDNEEPSTLEPLLP